MFRYLIGLFKAKIKYSERVVFKSLNIKVIFGLCDGHDRTLLADVDCLISDCKFIIYEFQVLIYCCFQPFSLV